MAKVKGSKQVRMMVVPFDPQKRRMQVLLGVTGLLALAALSFWIGHVRANSDYIEVKGDNESLRGQLEAILVERDGLQREAAQLKINSDVDQRATSEVRELVADMSKKLEEQKKEIAFYKGLMAPTKDERGLRIRSLDLLATDDPRRYEFKLVFHQLAERHQLLRGNATIKLLGKAAGKERLLSLHQISEQVKTESIKVRFRYYQNIEGKLRLPADFEPQAIEVKVKTRGKKPVTIEKRFGWLTQET